MNPYILGWKNAVDEIRIVLDIKTNRQKGEYAPMWAVVRGRAPAAVSNKAASIASVIRQEMSSVKSSVLERFESPRKSSMTDQRMDHEA